MAHSIRRPVTVGFATALLALVSVLILAPGAQAENATWRVGGENEEALGEGETDSLELHGYIAKQYKAQGTPSWTFTCGFNANLEVSGAKGEGTLKDFVFSQEECWGEQQMNGCELEESQDFTVDPTNVQASKSGGSYWVHLNELNFSWTDFAPGCKVLEGMNPTVREAYMSHSGGLDITPNSPTLISSFTFSQVMPFPYIAGYALGTIDVTPAEYLSIR